MPTFTYPTSRELMEIAQDKLPRLMQDRPIFDIFPVQNKDSYYVSWEQEDNYTGLQQVRGLNGDPTVVKAPGMKRYDMQPGVYGEFERVDEKELTTRRQYGTFNAPINISDLVVSRQDHLLGRRLDRIELIGWTLLATGTFSVASPSTAAIIHTDSYTTQTYTASPTWATSATAIPLADFRAVQLKSRGRSVSFGAQARAYMNRSTFNSMIANTNSNDLAGRRTSGLATVLSPADAAMLLLGEDLPRPVIYDEGYLDDTGTFQLFIPNNKVIVVGARAGGTNIGAYQMVRNANNPDLGPGAYMKVIDRGDNDVPRSIEVHDGHNGGPALFYPGSIVVMTV